MWHYEQDGQPAGPVDEGQLDALVAAGAVHAGTRVWRADFPAWRLIGETDYPGRTLVAPAPPPKPAAAPPPGSGAADPTTVALDEAAPWRFFLRCLSTRYFKFTGRARRKEYWSFVLLWWLVTGMLLIIIAVFDALFLGFLDFGLTTDATGSPLELSPSIDIARKAVWIAIGVFFLGTLIPSFAVSVRRLHDVGLTGWLVLLNMLLWPFSLVLMLLPTEAVANKHGPPPRPPRNYPEVT